MAESVVPALLVALAWSVLHVEAHRLRLLDAAPRSRFLSAAGGVSVSYVFLHLLPELTAAHRVLGTRDVLLAESAVFLLALTGLVTFYGLEHVARGDRRRQRDATGTSPSSGVGVYRVHLGAFSIYNALLAYLLVRGDDRGLVPLALYGIAIAFHFVVNDHALRQHHAGRYHAHGRWVLAASILAGWGIGAAYAAPETWTSAFFAALAGAIVLNVLKEEIPEERESRWWPFVLGAAAYGAIIVLARI